jgi:hypothetical protein
MRLEGGTTDFGFELALDRNAGVEAVQPGATGIGSLSFWAVDQLPELVNGQRFEIREGTRVIGFGEIIDASPQ